MLRKMYLVLSENFRNSKQPAQPPEAKMQLKHKKHNKSHVKKKQTQHPSDKWVTFRKKIQEPVSNIRRW
jgi:hypothetical protein